jgi:hypothetical protein
MIPQNTDLLARFFSLTSAHADPLCCRQKLRNASQSYSRALPTGSA